MIKSSYLFYLLSLIKTKAYAEEIIEKIDQLRESLYNKRVDLDKKMNELFSPELKEKIKSYSWQEQINLNDPESFGKFLIELRTYIKNMPTVTIYIAVEATEEIASEISTWFVEHYGKNIVLDLICDRSLIGGAKIIFNSVEKDYSLRKKIAEKYKPEDWQKFISQVRGKKAEEKTFTPLKVREPDGKPAQGFAAQ